jgi:hypothetical protein
MPKSDPRKALEMRRAFWADKAANAERCAAMDKERDSAFVADWTRRFDSAREKIAAQ